MKVVAIQTLFIYQIKNEKPGTMAAIQYLIFTFRIFVHSHYYVKIALWYSSLFVIILLFFFSIIVCAFTQMCINVKVIIWLLVENLM